MEFIALSITLLTIGLVAYLLLKNYYAQGVLMLGGIFLLITALVLEGPNEVYANLGKADTHSIGFNLIAIFKEIISSKLAGIGFLIMSIGGFVNYMKIIGASNALVKVAVKPLQYLKKSPYLTAAMLIPIGQFLFMATPSAAGLSLLLMVAVYPLLIRVGISKVSAVSVITACTIFDMGPASGNAHQAAELAGITGMEYFVDYQLKLTIPAILVMIPLYLFTNRYFDKKEGFKPIEIAEEDTQEEKNVPKYYALLPILPIVMLFLFSDLCGSEIKISAPIAMITSLLITMMLEGVRTRDFKQVLEGSRSFWQGAAEVFTSVVTLIICAEFFAQGIIQLGLIEMLVQASTAMGLGFEGLSGIMTSMIFGSSVLLGSGNASFFAFGPLVPGIIEQLGSGVDANAGSMLVTMQLAASTGRALSPIAGLIIATSAIAKISPFDVVKRNVIPLIGTTIFIFLLNWILNA